VHIVDICAAYTLDERIIKCLQRKENLVDSFKSEIEAQKDNKTIGDFIFRKTIGGRTINKKIKGLDKSDLLEAKNENLY